MVNARTPGSALRVRVCRARRSACRPCRFRRRARADDFGRPGRPAACRSSRPALRRVKEFGRSLLEGGVPQAMPGVELLDLNELDVGVLGPVRGFTGNPPLRTGQTCGQVCASPAIMSLLRSTALGNDFAVSRFPKPDGPRLIAKHNGVIPTPDHYIGAARHLSDGYQVTGRDPLRPRPRELRCVADRDNLTLGQDLADILFDAQHDAAVQLRGSGRVPGRSSHSAIMPRRPHPRPDT